MTKAYGQRAKKSEPLPKSEELPVKVKPLSDKGQNLQQNTRNQGYQQDR
jgi:hypothetical protein